MREKLYRAADTSRMVANANSLTTPFTFQACELDARQLERFDAGQLWTLRDSVWAGWVESFLSSNPGSLALAQMFGIKPSFKRRTAYWCIRDEVIAYADGSPDVGVDGLFRNMSPYPSVVVLCRRGREFVGAGVLGCDELEAIAASAEFVLIGAYDEESFVAARCAGSGQ